MLTNNCPDWLKHVSSIWEEDGNLPNDGGSINEAWLRLFNKEFDRNKADMSYENNDETFYYKFGKIIACCSYPGIYLIDVMD